MNLYLFSILTTSSQLAIVMMTNDLILIDYLNNNADLDTVYILSLGESPRLLTPS